MTSYERPCEMDIYAGKKCDRRGCFLHHEKTRPSRLAWVREHKEIKTDVKTQFNIFESVLTVF